MRYQCYGLRIDSRICLPELTPLDDTLGRPDVQIIRTLSKASPPPAADMVHEGCWTTPQQLHFEVPGVATFTVSDGDTITVMEAPEADATTVRLYLLGTVLGTLMMQRGHLVLHGNAIRVGTGCALALGHSGSGKSTLAAEFLRRGLDVLADDVVPVDSANRALPGYPRIKLWQDAAERNGLNPKTLARVRPQYDKFHVPFQRAELPPLPITCIYLLDTHDAPVLALEPYSGMAKFAPLLENTYRASFLRTDRLKAAHLSQCANLARVARVVHVRRPRDAMHVEETADAILRDIAQNVGPPEESHEFND